MEKVLDTHSFDGVGALGTWVYQELDLECKFNCTICFCWKAAKSLSSLKRHSRKKFCQCSAFRAEAEDSPEAYLENMLLCLQFGSWEGSRAVTYPPACGTLAKCSETQRERLCLPWCWHWEEKRQDNIARDVCRAACFTVHKFRLRHHVKLRTSLISLP